MNTPSSTSTPNYGFQDVILELMMVNENLEKVGKTFQEIRDTLIPLVSDSANSKPKDQLDELKRIRGEVYQSNLFLRDLLDFSTSNELRELEGAEIANKEKDTGSVVERIESADLKSKEQLDELKKIRGEVYQSNLFLRELLDFFTSKKLQEMENNREFLELFRSMRQKDRPSGVSKTSINGFPKSKISLGGLLAGFVPAILGALAGIVEGFIQSLRALKLGKLLKGTILEKAFLAVKGFFSRLGEGLANIGRSISNWWKILKADFPLLGEAAEWLGKKLRPLIKFMGGIFRAFRGFGNVIGKLLIPLQVILSIVDGITGFIEGYKNTEGSELDKTIGGLRGGITEIIKGLFALPLDLLKSAVSWIAGKFGIEGVEKALDSFSFSSIVDEMSRLGFFDFFLFPIRAIRGFMDAFNADGEASLTDKLIAGFKQGTMEIFDSLFGGFTRVMVGAVAWIARVFGGDDFAAKLEEMDPIDRIKDIFYGFVDSIVGFFKNIGQNITALFSGEINFMEYIKRGLATMITAFLAPISSLPGFGNIADRILESLNLPKPEKYQGVELKKSFAPPPPKKKAVSEELKPSETVLEPVANSKTLSGSVLNEYFNDTEKLKSVSATLLPVMANGKSSGGSTVVNNSTSQMSITQSTAIDRTSLLLTPMFSY